MNSNTNFNPTPDTSLDALRAIEPGVTMVDLKRATALANPARVWMAKSIAIASLSVTVVAGAWILAPRPTALTAEDATASSSIAPFATPANRHADEGIVTHVKEAFAAVKQFAAKVSDRIYAKGDVPAVANEVAQVEFVMPPERNDILPKDETPQPPANAAIPFGSESPMQKFINPVYVANSARDTLYLNTPADVFGQDGIRRVRDEADDLKLHLSGALQAGTLIGQLNTTGGGFGFNVRYDWLHVGFRYTSTFGTKGNSGELFRNLNDGTGRTYSQNITEYTLQLGATLRQGKFWATIAGGPVRTRFVFTSTNLGPAPGQLIPSSSDMTGIGAGAQASFGYRLNDFVAAELTGFATNHTQTYGGILLSIVVGEI